MILGGFSCGSVCRHPEAAKRPKDLKTRFFAPLGLRMTGLVVCFAIVFTAGCAGAPKHIMPLVPAKPPAAVAPVYYSHTVARGETLYRIAAGYHVSVDELMRLNGISDPSRLETGRRIMIPVTALEFVTPSAARPPGLEEIQRIVGPKRPDSVWKTITVHHSGTQQGSARLFHRYHLRRRMGGLFYHFVIGNGSHTPDGAVEIGWRWKKQVKANRPYDIQICLVGDFTKQNVSEAQFASLVNLIRILRTQYDIPLDNVRRHEDIKGKRTECPGKNFPFYRLLSQLAKGE